MIHGYLYWLYRGPRPTIAEWLGAQQLLIAWETALVQKTVQKTVSPRHIT